MAFNQLYIANETKPALQLQKWAFPSGAKHLKGDWLTVLQQEFQLKTT